jgi:hypothetical protein
VLRVNNNLGRNFGTLKGMRQRDQISSLGFNVARDVLPRMFRKPKNNGLIKGLVRHIIENGGCIFQYANDTIVLFQNNLSYGFKFQDPYVPL